MEKGEIILHNIVSSLTIVINTSRAGFTHIDDVFNFFLITDIVFPKNNGGKKPASRSREPVSRGHIIEINSSKRKFALPGVIITRYGL